MNDLCSTKVMSSEMRLKKPPDGAADEAAAAERGLRGSGLVTTLAGLSSMAERMLRVLFIV